MTFNEIEGNEKVIKRLKNVALSSNISHAYIFEGDACVDKKLIADCFIKAILCENLKGEGCNTCHICKKIDHGNYEDIIYIEADGQSIKDEAIETLQERLKKKPFSGERNIAVIKDADTMTLRAQNRLLKTLEEPAPGTVIILLSENVENMVETIRSRCVIYRIAHFKSEKLTEVMKFAEDIAEMLIANRRFYLIKEKLIPIIADKNKAYEFLDAFETVYRDLAIIKSENSKLYPKIYIYNAVEYIEEARRDLRRNIGTGYVLKNLIIKIGG